MDKTRVKGHRRRAKTGAVITVSTHDRMNTIGGPLPKSKPSISMNMHDGKAECSSYGIETPEDAKHVAMLTKTLQDELAAARSKKTDDEDA